MISAPPAQMTLELITNLSNPKSSLVEDLLFQEISAQVVHEDHASDKGFAQFQHDLKNDPPNSPTFELYWKILREKFIAELKKFARRYSGLEADVIDIEINEIVSTLETEMRSAGLEINTHNSVLLFNRNFVKRIQYWLEDQHQIMGLDFSPYTPE